MSKIYQGLLENLPPASQNGKRAYVIRKLGIFKKYPSEARKQELEDLLDNISIDYTERDYMDGDLMAKPE